MQYFKDFLFNLVLFAGCILLLLILFPTMMSQVIEGFGLLFGPVAILFVIAVALPRRRGRRRRRY